MCIFMPPAEVIDHQFFVRQNANSGIKSGGLPVCHRKGGAGFARQYRNDFARFAFERIVVAAQQQRDFIAFGIAIRHIETTFHQMTDGVRHQIAKTDVKRGFKLPNFLSQPRKAAPVQAHYDEVFLRHAKIVSGFVLPQAFVQIVESHRISLCILFSI